MKLIQGDCLVEMRKLPDNSVDSIVVDPPYGISFMGKKWDYNVPKVEVWQEALRVLKAGGHALVACGTRTQHRMAVNLEDAGFEIRDIVAWVYGSGFPKSHNIGKAIQKQQGVALKDTGIISPISRPNVKTDLYNSGKVGKNFTYKNVTTKEAKKYEGWGTALKPAMELWTLCRKPLSEKTIAKNVLKYGTGGINIDGCRVGTTESDKYDLEQREISKGSGKETNINFTGRDKDLKHGVQEQGRFPANFIHDGSDEVVGLFPNSKSNSKNSIDTIESNKSTFGSNKTRNVIRIADSGSASRFFYCAKASKSERNKGLDGFEEKERTPRGNNQGVRYCVDCGLTDNYKNDHSKCSGKFEYKLSKPMKNNHPTVKPIALMRYLCRLITPKGGTILDPFMGSGSTGIGAKLENFNFIGIELDEDYFNIAKSRIENYVIQTELEF